MPTLQCCSKISNQEIHLFKAKQSMHRNNKHGTKTNTTIKTTKPDTKSLTVNKFNNKQTITCEIKGYKNINKCEIHVASLATL